MRSQKGLRPRGKGKLKIGLQRAARLQIILMSQIGIMGSGNSSAFVHLVKASINLLWKKITSFKASNYFYKIFRQHNVYHPIKNNQSNQIANEVSSSVKNSI